MNDVAYGAGARLFHWVTVALLLIIIPVGLVMGGLPRGRLQDTLFVTHETLGMTVLGLTVLRLLWRLAHPPPPPSAALSPVERRASWTAHALLYLLLLAMPLTGYAFISFAGIQLHYAGLVRVPILVAKDKPVADRFLAVHTTLQWAVYALALLHIAAALHHHIVRRNDVLARMLPNLRRRGR